MLGKHCATEHPQPLAVDFVLNQKWAPVEGFVEEGQLPPAPLLSSAARKHQQLSPHLQSWGSERGGGSGRVTS
jgi:hypothetical protein